MNENEKGIKATKERADEKRSAWSSSGTMMCAGCGDNVPCRRTPMGWLCEDCRRDEA